jgi:hypothetical protein
MVSSGMLRHVDLVRTDVSEELSASFIRVTRISQLGDHSDMTYQGLLQNSTLLVPNSSAACFQCKS